MSEHSEEPRETEVSLEEALTKNLAAMSGESEDTPVDGGDDTTVETEEVEQVAEQVEASEDSLEPLERWSDQHKEVFRSLDRGAQEFLLDRHKEMEGHLTKESQSLSEVRKRYERIDEVLKPYDNVLKQQGLDITPYIGQSLQAYIAYLQDPVSTLKSLIQSSNLTQEQLFEDESADPDIRALRSELQQTKQELASMRQGTQQQTQNDGQAQIDAFKDAKDESGSLKHPHFEDVREYMAPLVAQGKSLEEAYDQSLWLLPDHRKAQLEAERLQAQKDAQVKNAEKVKKAKQASDTLPSSDVDKGNGKTEFKGWAAALKETLTKES